MNKETKTAIILLMKGILYKKEHEKPFFALINHYGAVSDFFETIGLQVLIDENDGYAYLRNIVFEEDEDALPKLISSRELSFKVSLLCVILREKLSEFEMQSDNEIAIVTQEELTERLLIFLENEFNEIKIKKEIETTINKVEELGFLKHIRQQEGVYEIRSAIKAFVDAQWLEDFDTKLKAYKEAKPWK
jgi:hypothetical protein